MRGLPLQLAAAAKSLQPCPTLCDPIDGSPPGSPLPGVLQARTLEWVAIFFSSAWKWKVKVKFLCRVQLLATPSSAAYQAPPSMGFSRQEWDPGVGCHCLFRPLQLQFSSVQSLSCVRLFATPWIAARQASLSITNSWSLLKLMPSKVVMPSRHLILCCPLLLLPPIPPSIRVFSNESTLRMRWPRYWSFSFSTSSSNEHPGLISFRMDWLDLLAVQGTLKSLLLCNLGLCNWLEPLGWNPTSLWESQVIPCVVLRAHPSSLDGFTPSLKMWPW